MINEFNNIRTKKIIIELSESNISNVRVTGLIYYPSKKLIQAYTNKLPKTRFAFHIND